MKARDYTFRYGCSVEATLDVIGGRWKGVILFHLLDGTKRFNELQRLVQGCTQRMLTLQLRELERDGVVNRTVYPQVPPKVEYSLTEFGHSLEPILLLMREWGDRYIHLLTQDRVSSENTPTSDRDDPKNSSKDVRTLATTNQ
jgi:DNA-binding HxlR family transcriptional regulator